MDLTRGNLDILFKGLNFAFRSGFELSPIEYLYYSSEFPSTTAAERYPFALLFGKMKEWIGERQLQAFSSELMEVVNKDFEFTVPVKRNDLKDDRHGIYVPILKQGGASCQSIWADMAIEALVKNGKWIDGSDFFVTTRKYGKNAIANKTTAALSYETYKLGRKTMMEYRGHNDKSLQAVPDTLMVGPALEETARKILEHDYYVESYAGDTDDATVRNHAPTPNTAKGTAKLKVNLELVGDHANKWYLLKTNGVIKPVGIQIREKPKGLEVLEDSKLKKDIIYGADARGAGFLTLPHLAYAGLAPA